MKKSNANWTRAATATVLVSVLALMVGAAQAGTVYWDGSGTSWTLTNSWSTDPNVATPDPAAIPGSGDDVVFNVTGVNSNQSLGLNADQMAKSVTFVSTGTVLISGSQPGTTARNLVIGSGGVTVNAAAGAATFGQSSDTVNIRLGESQTWINNSPNLLYIRNNAAGSSSATGAITWTVNCTGAGSISDAGALNDGNTTATVALVVACTGSGYLSTAGGSYSGGTFIKSGLLGASSLGTGTVLLGDTNGSLNATLNLNGGVVATNTIIVQSGSSNNTMTIATGSGSPTTQVLGGPITLNRDLFVNNSASASMTFSNAISGGGRLIKTGTPLVLWGANSHGGTILTNGTLCLNNAGALGLGPFTIASGTTIDNTSAGGISNLNNNAMNWNGNLTFTGSQDLNLGAGAVAAAAPLTLTANGSTLTVGGPISGGTNIFGITKTGNGGFTYNPPTVLSATQTLTVSAGTETFNGAISGGNGLFDVAKAGAGTFVYNPDAPMTTSQTLAVNAGTQMVNGSVSGTGCRLTKTGAGTLILNGADSYDGGTRVSAGGIQFGPGAVPANGLITLLPGTTLNAVGGYASSAAWLASGKIDTSSAGTLLISTAESGNVDLSAYGSLYLGSAANGTLSGTVTPGSNGYLFGGSGGALTLAGTDAFAGGGNVTMAGNLIITGSNDISGLVIAGSASTLTLRGPNGLLANGDVLVPSGETLACDGAAAYPTGTTRARNVTLSGGSVAVAGNAGTNTLDAFSGALTIAGSATVTVTPNASKNAQLTAGSLNRTNNGMVLFRGTSLGVNTIASQTANTANIGFSTTPTAQLAGGGGGAGSTTIRILPWAYGDTNAAGSGASLATYDMANGIRPLSIAGEYTTTITAGENATNNVRLTTAVTNSVASTINSLVMAAGASVAGTGRLTVASGAILAAGGTQIGITNAPGPGILDFGSAEGLVNMAVNSLTIVDSIAGNNGLTKGGGSVSTLTVGGGMSDFATNTYTGPTIINGGVIAPNKADNVTSLPGDIVVYSGSLNANGVVGQIASNANLTIYNGSFSVQGSSTHGLASENLANVSLLGSNVGVSVGTGNNGGSTVTASGNTIVSNATVAMRGKGAYWNTAGMTLWGLGGKTHISLSADDGNGEIWMTIGTNGLIVNQPANGSFTAVVFSATTTFSRRSALQLNGDLTYNGNAANTNAAWFVDNGTISPRGFYLNATNHTFTINPGGGPVDVVIQPMIVDSPGPAGITKAGAGTLMLAGPIYTNAASSSYSGPTTVSGGKLLVNGMLGANAATVTVAAAGTLGGTGIVARAVNVLGGTLAPGNAGGTLSAGRLILGRNLTCTNAGASNATCLVKLGGTTAGSSYDQIAVTNLPALVVLTNTTLSVSLLGGFVPTSGNTFTILDNQGTNAIRGVFAGLPEGSKLMVGQNRLQISYVGGTGNDIVLTSTGTVPRGTVLVIQ